MYARKKDLGRLWKWWDSCVVIGIYNLGRVRYSRIDRLRVGDDIAEASECYNFIEELKDNVN